MENIVYISLGSNEGDSVAILEAVCQRINVEIGAIVAQSSLYVTEPWGFTAENNFINSVISIRTEQNPERTLAKLLEIEIEFGRVRSMETYYQSRSIDLDIIAFGDRVIKTELIEIPHPRMHLRSFVLIPLHEIAKNWSHPLTNKGIEELLDELKDLSQVNLLKC